MFRISNQICGGIRERCGTHKLMVFTISSFILNAVYVLGRETSKEEENVRVTQDDLDIETASDDEIKNRLKNFGVHYSLDSVLNNLKPECLKNETVRVLLYFYEEKLKAPNPIAPPISRHPIISIDGFFTAGRSRVAKMVTSALHGRRILMPTQQMSWLKTYIGNTELRRHYHALGKYMGANLATLYCRKAPVILERYWHDAAAFVIARTFSGHLPENSSAYDFPKDLLVPDLMFFVNGALNPNVYNESTKGQHINNELSEKIAKVFRSIRPKPIEIGPPSLPAPMVKKILAIVEKVKKRFLPKTL